MTDDFWENSVGITPQPVSDTVVMRAANQLIKRSGDRAEAEAGQRSNAALQENDLFNYHLWQRVRIAVGELQQSKPTNPRDLN